MHKISSPKRYPADLGTLLLNTIRRLTKARFLPAGRPVPVLHSAPAGRPAAVAADSPPTAFSIDPNRHGQGFEDVFAVDLRALAARRQIVLDQIKAVQRDGSKPIHRQT